MTELCRLRMNSNTVSKAYETVKHSQLTADLSNNEQRSKYDECDHFSHNSFLCASNYIRL
jgi:hypothetical protein